MNVEDLAKALEQTVNFLKHSEDSFWSALSVEEIIEQLENELNKIKNSQQVDGKRLGYLFAPTGCIQDVSIDNGWGSDFIELSGVIDRFT